MSATMPVAGPPRSVPLPSAHETTLDNGMRVIAVSRAEVPGSLRVPLVSAMIAFDRGAAQDPIGRPGVAAMTAALLSQGTRSMSALELGVAIDAIGARLDKDASFDSATVGTSATTGRFRDALRLMAETVREPAFADDEFERVRLRSLSDLQLSYSSPSSLARIAFNRIVAGESAYGHPIAGTMTSLRAMTREDVVRFHAHAYRPERATMLIGGEITVDEAFACARATFGDWRGGTDPLVDEPRPSVPAPRRRVVIIDKADAGRTALVVGRIGIARSSPSYYAGLVATATLSGYSGRLNQEIRVKRGLSYGAGASLVARRSPGPVMAATLVDHARALEAALVMMSTLASVSMDPADGRELDARKASLLGGFSRSIETNDGLLGALADYALYDIPLDELELYAERIAAVSPTEIATFARDVIVPEPSIVMVGDAKSIGSDLSELAAEVTIVPFAGLDFDRAL